MIAATQRRQCRRPPSPAATPDGSLWVYLETIGGGSGARATKDGLDGVHVHMTNTSNLPVEALENEYPLTLLRYELVDGSGGAGTLSRRHGAAPGLPRRGGLPPAPGRIAASLGALGPGWRA